VLCVDVGSTFTKAVLVDVGSAAGTPDGRTSEQVLLATASTPTVLPPDGDVLDGVATVRRQVAAAAGLTVRALRDDALLVCSSAGGGLRLAVVGYEREVSAQAGHRVALSAGGRVVHVQAGPLDGTGLAALRAARPDVLLLVGGTDGGNADVLLHNAARLGASRFPAPVVLAGNRAAVPEAMAELTRRGRVVRLADNVLPRIGELAPGSARAALRTLFLDHVIGGKGLSHKELAGRRFAALVRAATPDAVLDGVAMLAETAGDVLVVDVGGATTDVYSALTPPEDLAARRGDVAGVAWLARTVEGDLGVRWSASGVLRAARAERLVDPRDSTPDNAMGGLDAYAAAAEGRPDRLPDTADDPDADRAADRALAALAVRIAVRRHGRPEVPGAPARPLRAVRLLVGSGGVLRHGDEALRRAVLEPVLADHGGGWIVPEQARIGVDERYVLFAAGLLAARHPHAARALIGGLARPGDLRRAARPVVPGGA